MSIDIRLPNITGRTDTEQLAQIKSYLYQFAEQLQWAFDTVEKGTSSENIVLQDTKGNVVEKTDEAKAHDTFNSIKDLIIKSADIVNAYSEEIDNILNLKGNYVAQSDFGTYTAETQSSIKATDTYVKQKFTKTEVIEGNTVESEYSLDDIDRRIRKQEGYIKSGNVNTTLTESGETIGIEIGEFSSIDGSQSTRFATFSAAGIELYGESKLYPVMTISQNKIKITSAEFSGFVKMGKYRVDLSNGIAFKWEEVL